MSGRPQGADWADKRHQGVSRGKIGQIQGFSIGQIGQMRDPRTSPECRLGRLGRRPREMGPDSGRTGGRSAIPGSLRGQIGQIRDARTSPRTDWADPGRDWADDRPQDLSIVQIQDVSRGRSRTSPGGKLGRSSTSPKDGLDRGQIGQIRQTTVTWEPILGPHLGQTFLNLFGTIWEVIFQILPTNML